MMLQVLVGVILVASKDYIAPALPHVLRLPRVPHRRARVPVPSSRCAGARELFYGLVGLFIMGLGIRAVLQVA